MIYTVFPKDKDELPQDFSTQEEYEAEKERFSKIGFRVVTYLDGKSDHDIHTGIKALVKNHWEENSPLS